MDWACERITVSLPPAGRTVERILAERDVVFDLTGEKGQKVHGTSERAIYTYGMTATATNEIIELTGKAVLETTNGTLQNEVLVLDRANNKMLAPGKYKIYGLANAGGTNSPKWLKK